MCRRGDEPGLFANGRGKVARVRGWPTDPDPGWHDGRAVRLRRRAVSLGKPRQFRAMAPFGSSAEKSATARPRIRPLLVLEGM